MWFDEHGTYGRQWISQCRRREAAAARPVSTGDAAAVTPSVTTGRGAAHQGGDGEVVVDAETLHDEAAGVEAEGDGDGRHNQTQDDSPDDRSRHVVAGARPESWILRHLERMAGGCRSRAGRCPKAEGMSFSRTPVTQPWGGGRGVFTGLEPGPSLRPGCRTALGSGVTERASRLSGWGPWRRLDLHRGRDRGG